MARSIYFEKAWTIEPGGDLVLPLSGEFLYVLDSDQNTFNIGIDGEPTGQARPGARFEPDRVGGFKEVRVNNPDPSQPLTVRLGWGQGRFQLTPTKVTATGAVQERGSQLAELPDVAVAAGATASIAAARTERRTLLVRNTSSTLSVFLRSDNALAESAWEIPPESVSSLEAINEVFAHNPGGSSVTVRVSELNSEAV